MNATPCPACGRPDTTEDCERDDCGLLLAGMMGVAELAAAIDALIYGHGRAAILHALAMVIGDVLAGGKDLDGNLSLISDVARRRAEASVCQICNVRLSSFDTAPCEHSECPIRRSAFQ